MSEPARQAERAWVLRLVGVIRTKYGAESEVNIGPFPTMTEAHDYFTAHRHELIAGGVHFSLQPLTPPEGSSDESPAYTGDEPWWGFRDA